MRMKRGAQQLTNACGETESTLERRQLAIALLGAIGGGAVLEACAAGGPVPDAIATTPQFAIGAAGVLAWVDTVLGAPPPATRTGDLATMNASAMGSSVALVIAKGCTVAGDGGGGIFYWEAGVVTGDDGGTIIVPSSATGRWVRVYSGHLNVKWFGAKGDSTTSDETAINAALAAASVGTVSSTVYFPAGTYMVSGLALGPNYGGVTLLGTGTRAPSQLAPDAGPPVAGVGTVIKLRTPAAFLLQVQTMCFRVENIWWDGDQKASDVVQFNAITAFGHFENCVFTGAALNTGNIHNYATTVEIDNLSFHRCTLMQDRWSMANRAAACVKNSNPNAFQIAYEDCYFAGAAVLAHFSQGSCDFYGAQMFSWTLAAIRVESCCQAFRAENVYNEGDTQPFFQQVLNAAASSDRPITIRDCQLNGTTAIVFAGLQPLTLINNVTAASVLVNPDSTYGRFRLTSVNTTFTAAGVGWSGSGYPNAVDELGTLYAAAGALSASRVNAPAACWNRTGTNADPTRSPTSYDSNGLSLGVATASPSTTLVLGDVHSILALTANRSYVLSSGGAVDGSRIRVSRLSASDSYTATIRGGVAGTGGSIALGSTAGAVGWSDWLFDGTGGGWVLVATGRV